MYFTSFNIWNLILSNLFIHEIYKLCYFMDIIKKGINNLLNNFYTNDNDDIEPVINIPFNKPLIRREYECEEIYPLVSNKKFDCVDDYPLGIVYAPFQRFENLYPVNQAHCAGTLFKDLYKPFLGYLDKRGAV